MARSVPLRTASFNQETLPSISAYLPTTHVLIISQQVSGEDSSGLVCNRLPEHLQLSDRSLQPHGVTRGIRQYTTIIEREEEKKERVERSLSDTTPVVFSYWEMPRGPLQKTMRINGLSSFGLRARCSSYFEQHELLCCSKTNRAGGETTNTGVRVRWIHISFFVFFPLPSSFVFFALHLIETL